mgnify:CR=1 FL=1
MKFSQSLKKNRDFQNVYKKGTSFANSYLVMYILENGLQENRIGISVSKKVGNSVVRHRITRLIRESYRLNEQKFVGGLDIDKRELQTVGRTFPLWNRYSCNCKNKCQRKKLS